MLSWLESTAYAEWVQVSLYGWGINLTLHAVGTATVLGIMSVAALRLLGFFKSIPYTALYKFVGLAWVGVAINTVTGFSLFMSNGSGYVTDLTFVAKMTFIIAGFVMVWYTRKVLRLEAAGWEAVGAVSSLGTKVAIGSLVLWTCALMAGRLTAYL